MSTRFLACSDKHLFSSSLSKCILLSPLCTVSAVHKTVVYMAGQSAKDMEKDTVLEMDEETKKTLTIIRAQLDLGQEAVKEEIKWEDVMPVGVDIDTIFDKINLYTSSFKDKLYKRFMKSKEVIEETLPEEGSGDELTRQLADAWNLYSRVGTDQMIVEF